MIVPQSWGFGAQGELALLHHCRRNRRDIFVGSGSFTGCTAAPELFAAGRSYDVESLR